MTTEAHVDCAAVLERLEELLDGDLHDVAETESGVPAIRRHLDACPECAAELALAATLRRELRALPELDAPDALIDRVLDATVRAAEPVPVPGRWAAFRRSLEGLLPAPARWAAATLAAAALAILVLVPRSHGPTPDPANDPELARAIVEARFALAYLGDLGRGAGVEIRDQVLRDRLVAPTVRGLLGPSGAREPADAAPSTYNPGGSGRPAPLSDDPPPSAPRRS